MSEHTPGPWTVVVSGLAVWSISKPPGQNGVIALCDSVARPYAENKANARLIAAAPELLAALEALYEDWNGPLTESVQLARAAIAKAKIELPD